MTAWTGDALLTERAEAPGFDRFYFNLHAPVVPSPIAVITGVGVYPPKGLVDGYVCTLVDGEQRNLRFSQGLGEDGPLRWATVEPGRRWHLALAPNDSGVELDVEWTARAPLHVVDEYRAGESVYDHAFQSGRYTGTLTVDGRSIDVGGWLGQRDRSRGFRQVRDRLGLHLWLQAQLPGESVGVLYNEDRAGNAAHCDGAVMGEDGTHDRIVGVRHDLTFDDGLELQRGSAVLELASGAVRELTLESTGRGLYMDGAGYGSFHGTDHGGPVVEQERWPLDGSRTPRTLGFPITDAFCAFTCDGVAGSGVTEYALTRSTSYAYRATL